MNEFYIYILECNDGSHYTGHTDDLEAGLSAHQIGAFAGYTKKRRPVKLVYAETFGTRDEAFNAERRIKGWRREKKGALINRDWDLLVKLSNEKK